MNRYVLGVTLAAAAILAASYQYFREPDLPTSAVRTAPPSVSTTPSLVNEPRTPAHPSATVPRVPQEPSRAQFSLSEKVRMLSASPSATDAFRAYSILAECKWAREEEQAYLGTKQAQRDPARVKQFESGYFSARIEQACGDLTAADTNGRIALVERAATEGVPLAALRLADEGPWGDVDALYTRPNDPAVLEWRAKVVRLIHLAAERGDVAALASLVAQYSTGSGLIAEKIPGLALRYAVAQHIIYQSQTGKPLLGHEKQIKNLSARLDAQELERAQAAGREIAERALGRAPK